VGVKIRSYLTGHTNRKRINEIAAVYAKASARIEIKNNRKRTKDKRG
jgi:hypothetical protein